MSLLDTISGQMAEASKLLDELHITFDAQAAAAFNTTKALWDLRDQLYPFAQFQEAFAQALVRRYGADVDCNGSDIRTYGLSAAAGYYDDPDFWCEGSIDPDYCAADDLTHWEPAA